VLRPKAGGTQATPQNSGHMQHMQEVTHSTDLLECLAASQLQGRRPSKHTVCESQQQGRGPSCHACHRTLQYQGLTSTWLSTCPWQPPVPEMQPPPGIVTLKQSTVWQSVASVSADVTVCGVSVCRHALCSPQAARPTHTPRRQHPTRCLPLAFCPVRLHAQTRTHTPTARGIRRWLPTSGLQLRASWTTNNNRRLSLAPELHCCALKAASARKPAAGCASWGTGSAPLQASTAPASPTASAAAESTVSIATSPAARIAEPGTTEALTLCCNRSRRTTR
jgi:hypothetical protein